jgi:hypothetical protein
MALKTREPSLSWRKISEEFSRNIPPILEAKRIYWKKQSKNQMGPTW